LALEEFDDRRMRRVGRERVRRQSRKRRDANDESKPSSSRFSSPVWLAALTQGTPWRHSSPGRIKI
jgi:hypothetical protein